MVFLTACGNNNSGLVPGDKKDDKSFTIELKTENNVELQSQAKFEYKDGFMFIESVPLFDDNGHITNLASPVYQYPEIKQVVERGFIDLDINLKATGAGDLYFDLKSDATDGYRTSLRVELYNPANSKSAIYSFNGGETVIEGPLDLDGDGRIDRESQFLGGPEGEEIFYSTGVHSYTSLKINSVFQAVQANDSLQLKAKIFIDGFSTDNSQDYSSFHKLDMIFGIR